jgi:hypothetical protein
MHRLIGKTALSDSESEPSLHVRSTSIANHLSFKSRTSPRGSFLSRLRQLNPAFEAAEAPNSATSVKKDGVEGRRPLTFVRLQTALTR